MAKRVPKDEKQYRPLEESLVRSVLSGPTFATGPAAVGGASPAVAVAAPAPVPQDHSPAPARPMPRLVPTTQQSQPAAAASAPPQPTTHATEAPPVRRPVAAADTMLEPRDREKRMLLTRSEERDVERLVDRLAQELGTSLKLSHVLRAYTLMLLHAEDEILDRARSTGHLARPGNGNAPQLAEFEKAVAQILMSGFRDAPTIR